MRLQRQGSYGANERQCIEKVGQAGVFEQLNPAQSSQTIIIVTHSMVVVGYFRNVVVNINLKRHTSHIYPNLLHSVIKIVLLASPLLLFPCKNEKQV